MTSRPVTVTDIVDRHVTLDVECLDQINLTPTVSTLQVPGQLATFLTRHLSFWIPVPRGDRAPGARFRRTVEDVAGLHTVPVVRVAKGDREIDVMRPRPERQAATGRSGLATIGVCQTVTAAATRPFLEGGLPQIAFASPAFVQVAPPSPGGRPKGPSPALRRPSSHWP